MHYVGVDVSEATLDLSDADGELSRSFQNSRPGVKKLAAWLQGRYGAHKVQVILEPTSTYHQWLIVTLASVGIAYTLVNPAAAAYYARSSMRRSKTDQIDARLLARMGKREQLTPSPPPVPWREGLKGLLRLKDALLVEAGAWHNRLGSAKKSPWETKEKLASMRKMERAALREANKIAAELWSLAKGHTELMEQIRLLRTVKGIGPKTALVIALELPPVEQCVSAKSWAAFSGLAPKIQQSGKSEYSLLSRMGSRRIRKAMYMPALVAMIHNPAVKAFTNRLKAKGKNIMVNITAAMHKLLRICFGVLKNRRQFDPAMHTITTAAAAAVVMQFQSHQPLAPNSIANGQNGLIQKGEPLAISGMPMP